MTKPKPSVVKQWLSMVANYGCVVTGTDQIVIHHCWGRKCKQDKYVIGELFVLPLAVHLHDNGNDPFNVTHHRKAFVAAYGRECDLFSAMCSEIGDLPFDDFWIDLIMKTGR